MGGNGNSEKLSFLGLQNHRSDCSYEIETYFLIGRKAVSNIDSMLKSRYITLVTKVHIVKGMVFPVVTYGCESWTVKSAEELIFLNCGAKEDC